MTHQLPLDRGQPIDEFVKKELESRVVCQTQHLKAIAKAYSIKVQNSSYCRLRSATRTEKEEVQGEMKMRGYRRRGRLQ